MSQPKQQAIRSAKRCRVIMMAQRAYRSGLTRQCSPQNYSCDPLLPSEWPNVRPLGRCKKKKPKSHRKILKDLCENQERSEKPENS
jgi:hypothetical protein